MCAAHRKIAWNALDKYSITARFKHGLGDQ